MTFGKFEEIEAKLWAAVVEEAAAAGLDPEKFDPAYPRVVADIAHFLQTLPAIPAPIVICGVPGTGKTTFLYVLDKVLHEQFGLPDHIQQAMSKPSGRSHQVQKRQFNGRDLSLLSVRKWGELLHFFTWSTRKHRLDFAARDQFVAQMLRPMRIIFADEVEMTGYAPTLPDLARAGLLVVGTSNQSSFAQLETNDMQPIIYTVGGTDMRAGDPADAIVHEGGIGWQLFDQTAAQIEQRFEQLIYRTLPQAQGLFIWLNFRNAIKAPLLETEWIRFMDMASQSVETPLVLMLEAFTLEVLRTDYNAIIRFVHLFDAIEQVNVGVLVRNTSGDAELSREALTHMKVTIQSARGITEEIKTKTVIGIDRCISRIGQGGHRAQMVLEG